MGSNEYCDNCNWCTNLTTEMCPPGEEPFNDIYVCSTCKRTHFILGCRTLACDECGDRDELIKNAYKDVPEGVIVVNYYCKKCRRTHNLENQER
jgi:DNA-directed RNA polymerase subunit RPC12/RpoP